MGKVAKWEDDLIHPNEWPVHYDSMPQKCKDLIDDKDVYALGIGKNEELGWFIAMSGQGPVIVWSEKMQMDRV